MKYYAVQIDEKGSIAVDDTILVKGSVAAAGSRILEGYVPLFSAEIVERLEKKGYAVSGKTHTGEFGLDLAGEFSYYAPKEDRILGAAAELVREGSVKAALGVDMTGAPRRAAALSGVKFLKPTYGTVSRYGLISCAASGEQAGVYANDTATVAEIMGIIAGHDDKDGTSLRNDSYDYSDTLDVKGRKVCLATDLVELADEDIKAQVKAFADRLTAQGVVVEEVSLLDTFRSANTAWQILMSAETCNNISRYDGVKFGHRASEYKNIDELYVNSRTEGFNFLTKAIILYGSDVLSKKRYKDCYDKSLRVKRVIYDSIVALLGGYDAIITPVCKHSSYEEYDIHDAFEKVFEESVFTSVADLTGVPALAGGCVQLIGKHFGESALLSLMRSADGIKEN